MPIPSQDLTRALGGDRASAQSLGRYLDSLQIIAGPQTAQLARGDGSAVLTSVQVIAGDGLTGGGALSADRTLNVGAGSGITVTADAVAVDDSVARNTWYVNAGSGLTGGGNLKVTGITLDVGAGAGISVAVDSVAVNQAYAFTWSGNQTWAGTATFNSTLAAAGGVASSLIPSATDTYDLGSSLKLWRKGWLSELDAVLFAQNVISVVGGWLMVSKGEGTLPADVAAAATTIDFGSGASIATNDFVIFRSALGVEYVQVGSNVSGDTWNVTRDKDGSGANDWPAGSVYVNLGYNGTGRVEINANSTPRLSILRQGTSYNSQTELVRIGDLNGWGAFVAEQYGWAVGDYSGGNYAYYGPSSGFKLSAGAGAVSIDANGIGLATGTGSANALEWYDASATLPAVPVSYIITGVGSSVQMGFLADGRTSYGTDKHGEFDFLARGPGSSNDYRFNINSSTATYGYNFYFTGGTVGINSSLNVASALTVGSSISASGVIRASGATATGVKSQESTVANNATAALLSATDRGVLIVTDSTQASAIFIIAGTFHDVKEVSDPYTVYAAAAGTASSTNVYWSAANSRYEIENKRGGGSVTYNITLIGAV